MEDVHQNRCNERDIHGEFCRTKKFRRINLGAHVGTSAQDPVSSIKKCTSLIITYFQFKNLFILVDV
jgi:hypothetical protein